MTKNINPKLKQLYEKNNRFFVILSAILFIVLGYFSYVYLSELYTVKSDIAKLESIETMLSANLSDATVDYTSKTELYTERRKSHLAELNKVFPFEAEKTNFTRFIDDYFFRNNFSKNEIFVKNMIFGRATSTEGYTVLPVSLSITSSKGNFMNFLKFVESSGALSSNTRLMDIQSIDVTFRDADDGQLYDYRISLNVYYQGETEM
ncbi:hypothetical protein HOG48_04085 [Candidatus Peregrinibacteria bacterium]|jgi:hypothetical protein|nr:hypothetical protein [Candidatus Peregrinibacteria bacterium]